MTRNLKALGLALLAVSALSAMAASSASAVDTFTTSKSPLAVTGVGTDNVYKITSLPGGTILAVECTTSHLESTVTNGASSATVKAKYEGRIGITPHEAKCSSTGGSTTTVNMNGCAYILSGNTTGSDGGTDATVSVECTPSTNEIILTTSLVCTIKIPAQTPTSGGVRYTNEPGKLKITSTSTGITFTSEGAGCPIGGIPSEANTSDLTGNVILSSAGNTISFSES